MLVSELLADASDLKAGSRVRDIACGNGNAAMAAARSGTRVLGIDYVPELLEGGRGRAMAVWTLSSASARRRTCPWTTRPIPATYLEPILTMH